MTSPQWPLHLLEYTSNSILQHSESDINKNHLKEIEPYYINKFTTKNNHLNLTLKRNNKLVSVHNEKKHLAPISTSASYIENIRMRAVHSGGNNHVASISPQSGARNLPSSPSAASGATVPSFMLYTNFSWQRLSSVK